MASVPHGLNVEGSQLLKAHHVRCGQKRRDGCRAGKCILWRIIRLFSQVYVHIHAHTCTHTHVQPLGYKQNYKFPAYAQEKYQNYNRQVASSKGLMQRRENTIALLHMEKCAQRSENQSNNEEPCFNLIQPVFCEMNHWYKYKLLLVTLDHFSLQPMPIDSKIVCVSVCVEYNIVLLILAHKRRKKQYMKIISCITYSRLCNVDED